MLLAILISFCLAQICLADLGKDSQPKSLYDLGLGKRAAYTYLSEYKRLPIYNFGLGKRADDSYYYGKRFNDMDLEYEDDDVKDDFKRMKQYSFGLGKRLPLKTYNFGLGKRSQFDDREASFNDGFDDDKRSNNGHRFSFGLGKRDGAKQELPGRRSMQYNFGLGKRSQTKDEINPSFNL
ncbi:helicostatins isoform X2 [Halyomorpha halys]|nr:helicostatins isoform X2 [Halyomorpha halys]